MVGTLSAERSIILPAVDAAGRGLQASFFRCGDRFAHTIAAVDGERLTPLLASVEGSDAWDLDAGELDDHDLDTDDWPASPPLQEVHVEQRDETHRVVLAVGRSGRSHWSLSVHAERVSGESDEKGTVTTDAQLPALVFDVAVRLHRRPKRLGSAYRSMVAASPTSDQALELSIAPWRYGVAIVEEPLIDKPNAAAHLVATPQGFVISAGDVVTSITSTDKPRTIRWKYRVSCLA